MKKNLDMELFISISLRVGVILSAVIMSVGFGWLLIKYYSGVHNFIYPHSFSDVFRLLSTANPLAIIDLGLLILILTPVFRVAASIFAFFLEGDYTYTAITTFVLTVLVVSFLLGKAGG